MDADAAAPVFLEVRVIAGVTGWEKLGGTTDEMIVWGCVACSLFFADVVLPGRKPGWQARERQGS